MVTPKSLKERKPATLEWPELPIETMPFPLQHPASVSPNKAIDQFFEGHVHSKSLRVRVRWAFRKFFNKS